MEKRIKRTVLFTLIICMLMPSVVYARRGDCGYEGGISSGEGAGSASMDYQEVCFITGEPIILKGTLLINKSSRQDNIVSTYTYNLSNVDRAVNMTRVIQYETIREEKYNGQTVEETLLARAPSEIIRIGETQYNLTDYSFTRSNIVDSKPAVDFFAGNTWGKKTYQVGNGAGEGTVTVEVTGDFYGYDQYWGSTEAAAFNYVIESEQDMGDGVDKWGGTARVTMSSSSTKQLKYVQNEPYQISFEGGYVQTQYNNSIMEYSTKFPEFDVNGISTDNIISSRDTLQMETFPVQKRLLVPDIRHLRGHWAEDDIRTLYSLEVFKGNDTLFNPERYISRAEFISVMAEAAKEVPEDPALTSRTMLRRTTTASRGRNAAQEEAVSPFSDVSTQSIYFEQIKSAYDRGLIDGRAGGIFSPNGRITVAEAITVFIRALGLEALAPNPGAVTTFRDNDSIPDYARDSVYVAQSIGLIQGDDRGFLMPNESLTKARAAALINRFINYMRDGIREDYREGIVEF